MLKQTNQLRILFQSKLHLQDNVAGIVQAWFESDDDEDPGEWKELLDIPRVVEEKSKKISPALKNTSSKVLKDITSWKNGHLARALTRNSDNRILTLKALIEDGLIPPMPAPIQGHFWDWSEAANQWIAIPNNEMPGFGLAQPMAEGLPVGLQAAAPGMIIGAGGANIQMNIPPQFAAQAQQVVPLAAQQAFQPEEFIVQAMDNPQEQDIDPPELFNDEDGEEDQD